MTFFGDVLGYDAMGNDCWAPSRRQVQLPELWHGVQSALAADASYLPRENLWTLRPHAGCN